MEIDRQLNTIQCLIHHSLYVSQGKVFPNFCTLTQECKNLKVRINAAAALRAPQARSHYGEHYALVWRGLLAAMENAANVDDFNEYKHKDNLIEQVCDTFISDCIVKAYNIKALRNLKN